MLTIKRDLCDRILEPAGITYFKTNREYQHVRTIPQKWDMLIPTSVQNSLGMYNTGVLTYIVNGKCSCNHDSTDSNRARLKESLKGFSNRQYEAMVQHVHTLLWENAMVISYCNMYRKTCDITIENVMRHEKHEYDDIMQTYQRNLNNLKERIYYILPAIEADKRLTTNLKKYIRSYFNIKTEVILGILIFLSLFSEDDTDSEFFEDFERHYTDEPVTKGSKHVDVDHNDMTPNTPPGMEVANPSLVQNLIKTVMVGRNTDTHELRVEIVYSNSKWWAIVCLE